MEIKKKRDDCGGLSTTLYCEIMLGSCQTCNLTLDTIKQDEISIRVFQSNSGNKMFINPSFWKDLMIKTGFILPRVSDSLTNTNQKRLFIS